LIDVREKVAAAIVRVRAVLPLRVETIPFTFFDSPLILSSYLERFLK
jgi:hypothetical protein